MAHWALSGSGAHDLPSTRVYSSGSEAVGSKDSKALNRFKFAGETQSVGRWPWLEQRQDGEGRSPTDPGYDPNTLHVPQVR